MSASETPPPLFGDFYREIYAKGMLAGERPTLPLSWTDLEEAARQTLDRRAVAYICGGSASEDSTRATLDAFRRWCSVPRVCSQHLPVCCLSVELSGTR